LFDCLRMKVYLLERLRVRLGLINPPRIYDKCLVREMLSGYYENAFIEMLSYPYLSSSFRQALAELYYSAEYGRGLLLVVGNRGSGKTTLLRHFQSRSQTHFRTLLLACADREMSQIWSDVVDKLGIEPPQHDLASMLARIEELQSQQAQPLILMLDDFQGKDRTLLETINPKNTIGAE
jgi:type II secretory pathway predicted ATPase ExeA